MKTISSELKCLCASERGKHMALAWNFKAGVGTESHQHILQTKCCKVQKRSMEHVLCELICGPMVIREYGCSVTPEKQG